MKSDDAKRIFNNPHDKYNEDLNAIRTVIVDLMFDVHILHDKVDELSKIKKGKIK